jgi:hypothetical protein
LEKMLAHQLAVAHKLAMEQMGQVSSEYNAAAQTKRLNAATRCMAVYQQELLALHKVRQNGPAAYHGAICQCGNEVRRLLATLSETLARL